MVVSDMVPCKDTLDLLEVPVRDAGNAFSFFGGPAHMPVETVRTVDAEAVAIVITFAIQHRALYIIGVDHAWSGAKSDRSVKLCQH